MDEKTGKVKKQDRVCSGILNRPHPKLKQSRSDVRVCADIEYLMKWLPEYQWTRGILLCASCRSWASRQAKERHTKAVSGAVLDAVVGYVEGVRKDVPPELSIYRGPAKSDDGEIPGPSSRQVVQISTPGDNGEMGLPIQTDSSTQSAAALRPLSEPSISIAARVPPRGPGLATPSRSNYGLMGTAGIGTGSASRSDNRSSNSSQSTPIPGSRPESRFPTPSSVATVSSYMDPEIAKEKLRFLLRQIAISPIEGREAQVKSNVSHKFRRFTKAVKGLFKDATGQEVVEPKLCDCEHCQLTCKTVKEKFHSAPSKQHKFVMLTSLPSFVTVRDMVRDYGVTHYMAASASALRMEKGMFSEQDKTKESERGLDKETVALIKAFYLDDRNSKAVPDLRYSILVRDEDDVKRPRERRNMYMNLRDAFEEFKAQNQLAKVKISKFAELRPLNVKWPGAKGFHETCTCQLHENFNFMVKGLRAASLAHIEALEETDRDAVPTLALFDYPRELVDFVLCVPPTEMCYLGLCGDCPDELFYGKLFKYCDDDVEYRFWSSADYTTISVASTPVATFQELFRICLSDFTTHEYIFRKQKEYIHGLKLNGIKDGTVGVLTVDFGQNYSMVVQNAVQSFHWNNSQATIIPFVLYTLDEKDESTYKTYFVISEDLGHDASSFHAYRVKVLERVKSDFPRIKKIEYVSDGCPGQFKNYKNIGNLLFHKQDFDLDANWHMTATSHGKSTCDAMCAVVKRTMRLRSLKNKVLITTAQAMYDECVRVLATDKLEFFYFPKEIVQQWRMDLQERYKHLRRIPAIRSAHGFFVEPNMVLRVHRYSSSVDFTTFNMIIPDDTEAARRNPEVLPVTPIEFLVGSFYAIKFRKTYQIGLAQSIDEASQTITCLMMLKRGNAGKALKWPAHDKPMDVSFDNILRSVKPPYNDPDKPFYYLQIEDLEALQELTKKI